MCHNTGNGLLLKQFASSNNTNNKVAISMTATTKAYCGVCTQIHNTNNKTHIFANIWSVSSPHK